MNGTNPKPCWQMLINQAFDHFSLNIALILANNKSLDGSAGCKKSIKKKNIFHRTMMYSDDKFSKIWMENWRLTAWRHRDVRHGLWFNMLFEKQSVNFPKRIKITIDGNDRITEKQFISMNTAGFCTIVYPRIELHERLMSIQRQLFGWINSMSMLCVCWVRKTLSLCLSHMTKCTLSFA